MGILRSELVGFSLISGLALGCGSDPLDDSADNGGSGSGGTSGTPAVYMGMCSAALRQTLGLVDTRSTADVQVLQSNGSDLTIYVDASVGGLDMQDSNPWVYVALAMGTRVELSDLEALESADWDIAFKRSVLRNNSGDSGPGQGGALRIALPWDSVSLATLGDRTLPSESWFDADCNLTMDASGAPVTSFSGWSEYNQATHVLTPAPDVTYLVKGGSGLLYKVAVLDYYSTPSGTTGTVAGRYLIRAAPLE
jgi:hypothetical protein